MQGGEPETNPYLYGVTPPTVCMAMHQPDGMGADMHRERQNMKRARQPTRTPPWELAAIDADGNELYRTEYQDSLAEAERAAEEATESLPNERLSDAIDHFEPVKTED